MSGTSTPPLSKPGFRSDIQGLRAVAVLLVVLYHAGVPFLPGGFVGVDVFFVISGFLITGLLAKELVGTGTISLVGFYARRARRLLPAATLVLVATAAASMVVLPAVDLARVGTDVVSAALFTSNWHFGASSVDYFATTAPSPLLHFWSLAVEEQFYLFWPLLLLLATRPARRFVAPRRAKVRIVLTRPMALALGLVAVPSLVWSLVQTVSDPQWAYVSTATRAWELCAGAAVALAVPATRRLQAGAGSMLVVAGLAGIAASAALFDPQTAFPGAAALLPVASAAAVLFGGASAGPAVAHVLSHRVLAHVGDRSYAWYLWHWPVLVLAAAALGQERLDPWQGLVAVGVAYVAAAAAYRLVEQPVHHWVLLARRPTAALATGVALVAVGLLAGSTLGGSPAAITGEVRTVAQPQSLPGWASGAAALLSGQPSAATSSADLYPPLGQVRSTYGPNYAGCHAEYDQTEPSRDCVFGDPTATRTVVLFGDSHAASWFNAVDRIAAERAWRLIPITKSSCSGSDVLTYHLKRKQAFHACQEWVSHALGYISDLRPDLVLTTGRTDYPVIAADGAVVMPPDSAPDIERGLASTFRRLKASAGHVVALEDNPQPRGDQVECLSENSARPAACDRRQADMTFPPDVIRPAAAEAGVHFLRTRWMFCADGTCPASVGRVVVYRDTDHVTSAYAATLAPYLERAVSRVSGVEW